MKDEKKVYFFETELTYEDLIKGVEGYRIEKKYYLIFIFENGNNIIGTISELLTEKFTNNTKSKLINFDFEELSFKNSLFKVNKSFGNFNLISVK